jgi:hypothetical protein
VQNPDAIAHLVEQAGSGLHAAFVPRFIDDRPLPWSSIFKQSGLKRP